MKITIQTRTDKEKSYKVTCELGIFNVKKSSNINMEVGKTYEIEAEESEWEGHKMKWVTSAVAEGATTQPVITHHPVTEPLYAKKEPNWEEINYINHKFMCIAYAKDLIVAGKIGITELEACVERMITFGYNNE